MIPFDSILFEISGIFVTYTPTRGAMQVPRSSSIQRLQRQHNVDLSAVASSHAIDETSDGSASPAGSDLRRELVGFAAASALRSLKVPHTVDEASGVLVCDAEDLSTWAHRRHIELLTRLQQRRRRRRKEDMHASHSSDSEGESDNHAAYGLHTQSSQRGMLHDLSRGSLTPGLSGRGAPGGAMQGGLNTQTSRLRASSLHAQHMMQPRPLPDSAACIWDDPKEAHVEACPSIMHATGPPATDASSAPVHVHPEHLEHMHEPQDAVGLNGTSAVAPGDGMHESHAHDAEESHVLSSGEW